MQNRMNKKGFTIVELVIVIAVIAVLAAVLIPTFVSLVNKANQSSDIQAARQMNEVLAGGVDGVAPENVEDAIKILVDAGFRANDILLPVSADHQFYWYKTKNVVVLVDGDNKIVYPEEYAEVDPSDAEQFFSFEAAAKYVPVDVSDATSFAEALKEGIADITLTEDVTITKEINVADGADVVINLNGKTLSAPTTTRPINLGDGATVTINAEGSTIETGMYGLVNVPAGNSGKVVINGGTYTADLDNGAFIKVRPGGEGTNVTIVLNNVTYKDASDDSYIINGKGHEGDLNVIVNGGSYEAAYGFQCNNITIDGATIVTDGYAIHASSRSGVATVKNCTITTGTAADGMPAGCVTVANGAVANVTGCTLSGANAALTTASSSGKIVASGNTITGTVYQNNCNGLYSGETETFVYIEVDGTVLVNETYK